MALLEACEKESIIKKCKLLGIETGSLIHKAEVKKMKDKHGSMINQVQSEFKGWDKRKAKKGEYKYKWVGTDTLSLNGELCKCSIAITSDERENAGHGEYEGESELNFLVRIKTTYKGESVELQVCQKYRFLVTEIRWDNIKEAVKSMMEVFPVVKDSMTDASFGDYVVMTAKKF